MIMVVVVVVVVMVMMKITTRLTKNYNRSNYLVTNMIILSLILWVMAPCIRS
jgi:hypothetical protein